MARGATKLLKNVGESKSGRKSTKGKTNKYERIAKKRMECNHEFSNVKHRGNPVKNLDQKPTYADMEVFKYMQDCTLKPAKMGIRDVIDEEMLQEFAEDKKILQAKSAALITKRLKELDTLDQAEVSGINRMKKKEAKRLSRVRKNGPRPGKDKYLKLMQLNKKWREEDKRSRRAEKKEALRAKKNPVKPEADDQVLTKGWDEVEFGQAPLPPPKLDYVKNHFEKLMKKSKKNRKGEFD